MSTTEISQEVSRYMARIGRKGGLKRKLTTDEAKAMAALSVAKRREQKGGKGMNYGNNSQPSDNGSSRPRENLETLHYYLKMEQRTWGTEECIEWSERVNRLESELERMAANEKD